MTRATRPGSVQDMFRRICNALGGVENAAADAGVSISTISYGMELNEARPGGIGLNHADRLCRMHPEAAEVAAQHFALLAGGTYLPAVAGGDAGADLARVMHEFSEVVAKHAAAHSEASPDPTGYTALEAAEQAAEVAELIAAASHLHAVLRAKAEVS